MNKFPAFPQDKARIGLLGVAFDENSSYRRGSALAPQKIRAAFFCDSSNLWTESETYLGANGLFADAGDIAPSQAEMFAETERAASRLHESGLEVFAFGGDHSVTYPLVKAAAKFHAGLSILHFDAHPDADRAVSGSPSGRCQPDLGGLYLHLEERHLYPDSHQDDQRGGRCGLRQLGTDQCRPAGRELLRDWRVLEHELLRLLLVSPFRDDPCSHQLRHHGQRLLDNLHQLDFVHRHHRVCLLPATPDHSSLYRAVAREDGRWA